MTAKELFLKYGSIAIFAFPFIVATICNLKWKHHESCKPQDPKDE